MGTFFQMQNKIVNLIQFKIWRFFVYMIFLKRETFFWNVKKNICITQKIFKASNNFEKTERELETNTKNEYLEQFWNIMRNRNTNKHNKKKKKKTVHYLPEGPKTGKNGWEAEVPKTEKTG